MPNLVFYQGTDRKTRLGLDSSPVPYVRLHGYPSYPSDSYDYYYDYYDYYYDVNY
jgi:hypothetical protein